MTLWNSVGPGSAESRSHVEASFFELSAVDPNESQRRSVLSTAPVSAVGKLVSRLDMVGCEAVAVSPDGAVANGGEVLDCFVRGGVGGRYGASDSHFLSFQ